MKITPETRDQIRRAVISIMIGAVISALAQVIEMLLNLGREKLLDLVSSGLGMLYYLKSRKMA